MSRWQRFVVLAWGVTVAICGIFPPWSRWMRWDDKSSVSFLGSIGGYHPVFAPPALDAMVQIDLCRLGVEWIAATAIFAGLYFAWPDRIEHNRPGL
jgi:hypothetical protein